MKKGTNTTAAPAVGSPLDCGVVAHAPRHPTLAECEAAGRGPENYPGNPFEVGGLPATKEERARFEAYMRGHAWDVGHYVSADECYDTTFVRCLFGLWRDRGALPTVWPNGCGAAGIRLDDQLGVIEKLEDGDGNGKHLHRLQSDC
jgi:hypothetical protein